MFKGFLLIFIILFYFPLTTIAVDSVDILVEDSMIQEDFTQASPSVSVIQAAEIKKNNMMGLSEVLSRVAGISVAQNGDSNQPTSVFIRGAESRHTLVLIDGIEVNDTLSPSRSFDFSNLTTENIERIEVFKGAQSVRFGSDAIGGVINIITKEGTDPASVLTNVELGSYETLKAGLHLSGAKNNFRYSFGINHLQSTGFSSADKNNGNSESDGFKRLSLTTRLGWILTNETSLNFTLRAAGVQSDLDAFGGPGGDDPNHTSDSRQLQVGTTFKSRAFEELLSYSLSYGLASSVRTDENEPDALQPDQSTDYFIGVHSKIESRNEYTLSETQRVNFGAQIQTELGHSENTFNGVASDLPEKTANSKGVYAIHKYESKTFLSELGLRQDFRDQFGSIVNYNLNAGYKVPTYESLIYFNYASGFKTPSLYQLYSSYGNQNLNEEKSNSAEFAVEKSWGSSYFVSVSYFINQYHDLIDFDSVTSKYFNIAKSSSKGLELQSKWRPTEHFFLKGTFTHLNAKNEVTGNKLLRRPELHLTFEATYLFEQLESSLEYLFSGNRTDMDPVSFQPTTMPDYDLVNVKWTYTAADQLSFNARIANLFNRQYQSVAGYGTAEFSVYAGLTKAF